MGTAHDTDNPATVEPIAIVGLACRVPGARSAEEFWRNLTGGTESLSVYTLEQQAADGVPKRLLDDPNWVPAAMVLDDMEYFDPGLFGMTGREAEVRDPQHRVFLELAHTALEDAGHDPARFTGDIGVYGAVGADEYQWRNLRRNPKVFAAAGPLGIATGTHPDYLATLAAYKLNLRGPALTVHTACSSSLVATHLAVEALRTGECDMALAGGVSIELPHRWGYLFDEGGINAPDGHCRAFDASARGTIWGSGGGVVVLRRPAARRRSASPPRRWTGRSRSWRARWAWPTSTRARSPSSRRTAPAPSSATRSRSRH
jgi:phthiocerol/phenolphthiocerol synthesis type-I polyketide synthase E